MHACLLLFPTTSTCKLCVYTFEQLPFPITISSHIHVFLPLQASSTASSRTSWRWRCGFSRGALKLKVHFWVLAHS